MRYAVTGATGFLGANLVRTLLAEGHEVVALIRKPNALLEGLDLRLKSVALYRDDTAHVDALASALKGCDGLFHLAGIFDPSAGGQARMKTVHVDATRSLCTAAARGGVPRVVLCSSSITVGFGPLGAPGNEDSALDPTAAYGHRGALRDYHDTKLAGEQVVLAAPDIEGVIVNPDFIIGPYDVKPTSGQMVVSMARHPIPFYPMGGKCFQTAADCATGHLLAMERGQAGRRYLLGSHNLSYREFLGIIAECVGRRPPMLPLPPALTRAAGLIGRVGSRFDAHRFAGLNRHVLSAMQADRYRSDARARAELGLVPTPIRSGVSAALAWFQRRGYC